MGTTLCANSVNIRDQQQVAYCDLWFLSSPAARKHRKFTIFIVQTASHFVNMPPLTQQDMSGYAAVGRSLCGSPTAQTKVVSPTSQSWAKVCRRVCEVPHGAWCP